MFKSLEIVKAEASTWFYQLQDSIIHAVESLEKQAPDFLCDFGPAACFQKKPWERPGGGGGTMAVMEGGRIIERMGVNVSVVHGEFAPEFRAQIPGTESDPRFWASGISLVVHPRSPLIPTMHFNTRLMITQKHWWGGGIDMTPCLPVDEDTEVFHRLCQEACDRHDPSYYVEYKKWCDEYFYLPHRGEMRGVGGIFYDNHARGTLEADFAFTQDVGQIFLKSFVSLVQKYQHQKWTPEQRQIQLKKRGRYVEFNLLYDRGTKFGLMTGGNTEAILVSMPPLAAW